MVPKIYSGFGHQVNIYTQLAEFPDWISHSSNSRSTLSLDLQPNESHNFLGMVLCLKICGDNELFDIKYSVKTTTSDLIWSDDRLYTSYYHESWMVIVPRSFFSAGDGDDRIELTANAEIHGLHLL
ncbi:hypothetical protein POM88_020107 [Heracleum sosnowskyi]|uniref:Uncharacterized protein n=1 Tax=Heracleum sosnowskyi TaxID=360622 RepID=A0AAD8IAR9_9APIA|nr:hypothetical protein POM88_020107 [Heracleum sosnowskyi]